LCIELEEKGSVRLESPTNQKQQSTPPRFFHPIDVRPWPRSAHSESATEPTSHTARVTRNPSSCRSSNMTDLPGSRQALQHLSQQQQQLEVDDSSGSDGEGDDTRALLGGSLASSQLHIEQFEMDEFGTLQRPASEHYCEFARPHVCDL
jgi:hypothetical protein